MRALLRSWLVLAAGLAVAVSAAACGSGTNQPSGTAATTVPAPGSSATGTVTVWHYLGGTPALTNNVNAEGRAFMAKYPNVTVKNVYVPADQLVQKVLATVATGGGPDVLIGDPTWIPQLSQAHAVADLTSYWSHFDGASQFPASVQVHLGGKLLAVQGYVNTVALWYNKTILDRLGLQPPTTVGQLQTDLRAGVAAGYQGLALCGKPSAECEFQAYPWLAGNGATYANFGEPGVARTFSLFSSWVAKGYIPREAVNWAQTDAFQTFLGGHALFTENGNWEISHAAADAKFKYGIVQIPAGPQGSHTVGGGESESILSTSKHPGLAFAYLENTWFSKAGEIMSLNQTGQIPTRRDAALDPAISANPLFAVYSKAVQDSQAWPSDTNIANARTDVGTAWSQVLSGQASPTSAAQSLASQIKSLLGT